MSQDAIQIFQKARHVRAFFYLPFLLFILTSCVSLQSRIDTAERLIQSTDLQSQTLQTAPFPLFSAHKNLNESKARDLNLTIVIEGDGYAWVNRYTLSNNPTPKNPIGLKIAAAQSGPTVYLARPCQYIFSPNCTPEIWSSGRFGRNVIHSYMDALNQIREKHNVTNFNLMGFSGGGYIALTLAAQRNDIKKVTTIAGVLDPKKWTAFHKISPLALQDSTETLLLDSKNTRFDHLCSPSDTVMPCALTKDFIAQAQALNLSNHIIIITKNTPHSTWGRAIAD